MYRVSGRLASGHTFRGNITANDPFSALEIVKGNGSFTEANPIVEVKVKKIEKASLRFSDEPAKPRGRKAGKVAAAAAPTPTRRKK